MVISASGSSFQGVIEYVISTQSPYYDFYLPREAETIHSSLVDLDNQYAGRRFTNAIIDADVDGTGSYSAIGLIQRELNKDPDSAIEYCLNKNRRNSLIEAKNILLEDGIYGEKTKSALDFACKNYSLAVIKKYILKGIMNNIIFDTKNKKDVDNKKMIDEIVGELRGY